MHRKHARCKVQNSFKEVRKRTSDVIRPTPCIDFFRVAEVGEVWHRSRPRAGEKLEEEGLQLPAEVEEVASTQSVPHFSDI